MYGTGWLGWSAEQTLDTPISQIFLAINGKIDFVKKSNPYGSEEEEPSGEAKEKLSKWHLKKAEFLKGRKHG
jgi:hypothetical protein